MLHVWKVIHVWIALLPNFQMLTYFHLERGTFTVSMWPEQPPEVV